MKNMGYRYLLCSGGIGRENEHRATKKPGDRGVGRRVVVVEDLSNLAQEEPESSLEETNLTQGVTTLSGR